MSILATYQVIANSTFVLSSPSISSSIISTLNAGDQIEVISMTSIWSYFKYNNKDAYVSSADLKLMISPFPFTTGSLTIQYIDMDTRLEVAIQTLYQNLQLKSYTCSFLEINGYILSGDAYQTITLTEDNPNQTITFLYKKLLGKTTVQYLDIDSDQELTPIEVFNDLILDSYTYTAKDFLKYSLFGSNVKSVILTKDMPNQIITFTYKKIIIYGSVDIRYINTDTKEYLDINQTEINLPLGIRTYTAQLFSGYNLIGNSTVAVSFTEDNPHQTIIFEYKKILGSITIKYIDKNTQLEIAPPTIFNNLEIKSYSYNYLPISGYNISGNISKTVILSESLYDRTIVFEYIKILGRVSVKYIHVSTQKEIAPAELFIDLDLKEYTYNSKSIDGYTLVGDSSKSITLSDISPVQSVIFEYKTTVLTLDPTKQNQVPYISTYYIKPVVDPNEEVIIDYYITDYYHKEYVKEDFSDIFTVTVKIDGKPDIVKTNLKAGDQSISLGKFINLGEQKFSILCTDQYGRNSHELFNFFLVQGATTINEYIMTTQDLVTYKISNTNDITMVKSTREGLQKLLDDKKALGFNKLKLLAGTYRIDYLGTIFIPTQFTLDMNGATLKLHEFSGDKALMIELNNTFDSHVINGTIEGDFYNHDYTNSPNNSEWVHGVSIGGESKYSSFENLTIKDITGYGAINGIKNSRDNKLGYTYLSPRGIGNTFKLGDIDRNTGLDIVSTNRTTCDFRDITGYSDIGYLTVSVYLGYQGNPCGTWNLICHFYDANKSFIKSTDAYQYRRVKVPSNAKFMRVTILNEAYPTNLSIQLFRLPTHCAFKNLILNNCRSVGIAPQAMNNMLFENCTLTKCGSAVTVCALDAEDGWDMMSDATFKGLNFYDNPYNEFLICAGHNLILENLITGKLNFKERSNSYIVRNCTNITGGTLGHTSRIRTGYARFYNNNVNSSLGTNSDTSANWPLIIKDCNINGRAEGKINGDAYIRCNISASLTSIDSYSTSLGTGDFRNCYIRDKKGNHNFGGIYNNCKLENISGGLQKTFIFNNCTITNFKCSALTADFNLTLKNSNLNTVTIDYPTWFQGAPLLIDSCSISNTSYLLKLPHYAMKKSISFINNTFISNSTVGMVNFYDDRTGGSAGPLVTQDILTLSNNLISLPNSQYVITGLNKNTVNNINIASINNKYSPTTLLLCNPDAKQCPNITIKEG